MSWQPIESAPKPEQWIGTSGSFLVAKFWQPRDEEGHADGPPEVIWAHVAYLTASGWMCATRGFAGTHGFASFKLSEATHWQPLPAAPQTVEEE